LGPVQAAHRATIDGSRAFRAVQASIDADSRSTSGAECTLRCVSGPRLCSTCAGRCRSPQDGSEPPIASCSDHRGEQAALALGHRRDRLRVGYSDARQELAAAGRSPLTLAGQQLDDRHVRRLPWRVEDDLADAHRPRSTSRLSSARATRTALARRRARICCAGARSIVAASCIPLMISDAPEVSGEPASGHGRADRRRVDCARANQLRSIEDVRGPCL
jgi:hypothetical protein